MTLKKARLVVLGLLILGIIVGILGLLIFDDGTQGLKACTTAATVLLIAALMACGLWCRCPHCKKRLFRDVLKMKVCPGCSRDFETGEKKELPKKSFWKF